MGPIILLIIVVVMFGMAWFMNNSAKKEQKRRIDERDKAIKVGVNVVTGSGFYGKIVAVDGDAVTLESPAGDETVWMRAAIQGAAEIPLSPITEEEAAAEDAAEAANAAANTDETLSEQDAARDGTDDSADTEQK